MVEKPVSHLTGLSRHFAILGPDDENRRSGIETVIADTHENAPAVVTADRVSMARRTGHSLLSGPLPAAAAELEK